MRHFVGTPSGETMHYTLKDHQGSLMATVHGSTVKRLSYDLPAIFMDPCLTTNQFQPTGWVGNRVMPSRLCILEDLLIFIFQNLYILGHEQLY